MCGYSSQGTDTEMQSSQEMTRDASGKGRGWLAQKDDDKRDSIFLCTTIWGAFWEGVRTIREYVFYRRFKQLSIKPRSDLFLHHQVLARLPIS